MTLIGKDANLLSPHPQHHPNPEMSKKECHAICFQSPDAHLSTRILGADKLYSSPRFPQIPLPTNRPQRSPNRNPKHHPHPPAQLTVSTLTRTKPHYIIDIHPPVSLRCSTSTPPPPSKFCHKLHSPHKDPASGLQFRNPESRSRQPPLHPRLYSVQFGDVARKSDRFICTPLSLPATRFVGVFDFHYGVELNNLFRSQFLLPVV
jgi:hypothetical protein